MKKMSGIRTFSAVVGTFQDLLETPKHLGTDEQSTASSESHHVFKEKIRARCTGKNNSGQLLPNKTSPVLCFNFPSKGTGLLYLLPCGRCSHRAKRELVEVSTPDRGVASYHSPKQEKN